MGTEYSDEVILKACEVSPNDNNNAIEQLLSGTIQQLMEQEKDGQQAPASAGSRQTAPNGYGYQQQIDGNGAVARNSEPQFGYRRDAVAVNQNYMGPGPGGLTDGSSMDWEPAN